MALAPYSAFTSNRNVVMSIELEQLNTSPDEGGRVPLFLDDVLGLGTIDARAAYLHVPFCFHKCHYCDFYSIVDTQDRQEVFVERMDHELRSMGPRCEKPLSAVFIGGGTPTLLRPELLARLLGSVTRHLPLASDCEWTVEANPETVDQRIADVLVEGGVNRVSVGCQSFQPTSLKMLERHHEPRNVGRAVEHVRASGIKSINLDLIMGIPGSVLSEWIDDLDQALALDPEHLSCYGLQYEPNTPLSRKLEMGHLQRLDDELEAAMYEYTVTRLSKAGFDQYEISNWSRPGRSCQHNLVYWRSDNWLAFGPSASGHLDGTRWKITPRLSEWLASTSSVPVVDVERLDDFTRTGERLMLELRLVEGIAVGDLDRILDHFDPDGERRLAIQEGLRDGLLHQECDRMKLTHAGRLLADSLLSRLV
jgi:oxygen-independent coproporphyrinogen-3 oxidase